MLRILSSLLFLPLMVQVAGAEGLEPCAGLSLSWQCTDGTPVALAERNPRDDPSLTYRLLNAGRVAEMGPELTAVNFAGAGTVTVVGLPVGEGPCCLSQRFLTPPPQGLCTVSEPPPDDPQEPQEPPPPAPQPMDFALAIEAQSPCPLTGAGNLCRGALRITREMGTPSDTVLPLTVAAVGAGGLDMSVGGAGACNTAGPGAQFCQVTESATGRSDLTLAMLAPASFERRRVEICAGLLAPEEPSAQMRLVQTALTALGFDPGPIDGQDGPRTREAVAQLAPALGLPEGTEALDPTLLAMLGLGPFADEVAKNNRACTVVDLEPRKRPACDPVTTRLRGAECVCRYDGMRKRSATACSCLPGLRFEKGRGCVARLGGGGGEGTPILSCDPASTVKRNGACVCRYDGMRQATSESCVCRNGEKPVAGAGCP